jgi:hypothetical protein
MSSSQGSSSQHDPPANPAASPCIWQNMTADRPSGVVVHQGSTTQHGQHSPGHDSPHSGGDEQPPVDTSADDADSPVASPGGRTESCVSSLQDAASTALRNTRDIAERDTDAVCSIHRSPPARTAIMAPMLGLPLCIRQPGHPARIVPLPARSTVKIGRMATCDIPIDHASLSRMHAVIEVSPSGALTIIDLGSSSGTQVNGSAINKATLNVGDVVVLGEVTIEIGGVADAPSAGPPAPSLRQQPPPSMPTSAQAPPSGASTVFAVAIAGMVVIAISMFFVFAR